MELRGQEKEIGMPNSLGYNQKLSSPPPLASNSVGERRRDQSIHGNTTDFSPPQTLDHYPPFHQHLQSNLQQQTHRPRRDLHPNPDPAPAPIGATTSTPIASTSNLRSPPPPPSPPAPPVRYRECLKNHAARTGGHVMDGCGEFMPSGEEGTAEALKCAACECHRNFHRKETEGESSQQYVANCYNYRNKSCRSDTNPHHPPPPLLPPPPPQLHQHQRYSPAGPIQPMMMAFGGCAGAPAESSSEDLNMFQSDVGHGQASVHQQQQQQPPLSKKRFRTKFSQEQKDRMMEFAEKLDWKIQKQDEHEVQRFCGEVGVKRKVFKVWMHNNKQAMKKKQM